MNHILLYKESAGLTHADMTALRDAGFVPIRVKDFADVKVIDPMEYGEKSAVWMAAMEAITKASSSEGPKTIFGRVLAEKLSQCTLPTT